VKDTSDRFPLFAAHGAGFENAFEDGGGISAAGALASRGTVGVRTASRTVRAIQQAAIWATRENPGWRAPSESRFARPRAVTNYIIRCIMS
jgi:hypothetical protein